MKSIEGTYNSFDTEKAEKKGPNTKIKYTHNQLESLKEEIEEALLIDDFYSETHNLGVVEPFHCLIDILNSNANILSDISYSDRIEKKLKEKALWEEEVRTSQNPTPYKIMYDIVYSEDLTLLPLHLNDGYKSLAQWRLKIINKET